jgi:hypothetical protein
MENNDNVKNLLDKAYENMRMGSYAIDCIMERIKSDDLAELIRKQNKFYLDTVLKIEELARKEGYKLKDISMMLKGMSYLSIKTKTAINNETAYLAELLVRGTTMGITDMIKSKNENPCENAELLVIVERIISHEEEFVDSLKTFL